MHEGLGVSAGLAYDWTLSRDGDDCGRAFRNLVFPDALVAFVAPVRDNRPLVRPLRRLERTGSHVGAIRQKIGAANRTEAVAIAMRKYLLKF